MKPDEIEEARKAEFRRGFELGILNERVRRSMEPSVGRIVHYVSHGTPPRSDGSQAYTSQCRAAIVTEVCDNPGAIDPETGTVCASLAVLNPTGMFFNTHVPYEHEDNGPDGKPRGGTWHWPERV